MKYRPYLDLLKLKLSRWFSLTFLPNACKSMYYNYDRLRRFSCILVKMIKIKKSPLLLFFCLVMASTYQITQGLKIKEHEYSCYVIRYNCRFYPCLWSMWPWSCCTLDRPQCIALNARFNMAPQFVKRSIVWNASYIPYNFYPTAFDTLGIYSQKINKMFSRERNPSHEVLPETTNIFLICITENFADINFSKSSSVYFYL